MIKTKLLIISISTIIFIALLYAAIYFTGSDWSIKLYYYAVFALVLSIIVASLLTMKSTWLAIIFYSSALISGLMFALYLLHFILPLNYDLQLVFNWPMLISSVILGAVIISLTFSRGYYTKF